MSCRPSRLMMKNFWAKYNGITSQNASRREKYFYRAQEILGTAHQRTWRITHQHLWKDVPIATCMRSAIRMAARPLWSNKTKASVIKLLLSCSRYIFFQPYKIFFELVDNSQGNGRGWIRDNVETGSNTRNTRQKDIVNGFFFKTHSLHWTSSQVTNEETFWAQPTWFLTTTRKDFFSFCKWSACVFPNGFKRFLGHWCSKTLSIWQEIFSQVLLKDGNWQQWSSERKTFLFSKAVLHRRLVAHFEASDILCKNVQSLTHTSSIFSFFVVLVQSISSSKPNFLHCQELRSDIRFALTDRKFKNWSIVFLLLFSNTPFLCIPPGKKCLMSFSWTLSSYMQKVLLSGSRAKLIFDCN